MRLMTIAHSFKEGILNFVRHPLVALASISTIAMMLALIGAFVVFSDNVRVIVEQAGREPPVTVWADYDIDSEQADAIYDRIAAYESVEECTSISPEQAFETYKEEMGDKAGVLDRVDPSILSYQFSVRLSDPDQWEAFSAQAQGIPGVRRVDYSREVMDLLGSVSNWVNIGIVAAFVVLCAISLFIISNMVRISVYARGTEISIMKYVGATNAYIRFPYILEGAIVGLTGALVAWGLVWLGYDRVYTILMDGVAPDSFLAMIPVQNMIFRVLAVDVLIGVLVGSFGSALSVRRHIRV